MTATTSATPEPVRAAIYCRMSRDDAGDQLGVRRQERDARALCARRGWEVATVYVDDDVSAWSGKRRPAYEDMLDALRGGGGANAVVAYDLDRLHRSPKELEHFFEVCDRAGVTRMATCAGDVDLATSDGRLVARIMGAVARKSSDDTSRRLKRKAEELAELGKPNGGRRPFGYEADLVTVNLDEAGILRSLAARVLAGEATTSLARELNAQGVPCCQGGKHWGPSTLRAILVNPRHAGLRVHRDVVVGEAAWPAILDRPTHERLVAHFGDPARRRANPPRRSLLTGLVRCGLCGCTLTRDTIGPRLRSRTVLRCHNIEDRAKCGHVTIMAGPVEELLVEAVLQRADGPELARALAGRPTPDDSGVAAELADVEERLGELADMYAKGEIDRGGFLRARRVLEARQAAARAALSRRRR
ncbi:MAG: recombinase family protein [Acidimicrobiales bacterium]